MLKLDEELIGGRLVEAVGIARWTSASAVRRGELGLPLQTAVSCVLRDSLLLPLRTAAFGLECRGGNRRGGACSGHGTSVKTGAPPWGSVRRRRWMA